MRANPQIFTRKWLPCGHEKTPLGINLAGLVLTYEVGEEGDRDEVDDRHGRREGQSMGLLPVVGFQIPSGRLLANQADAGVDAVLAGAQVRAGFEVHVAVPLCE